MSVKNYQKIKLSYFLIFGTILLSSQSVFASNYFTNAVIGEDTLKGVPIDQVPTNLPPLPRNCKQLAKWVKAHNLEGKLGILIPQGYDLEKGQCIKLMNDIEILKKSQLSKENLTQQEQFNLELGDKIMQKIPEDFRKKVIDKTFNNTNIEESKNYYSQISSKAFVENLSQLLFEEDFASTYIEAIEDVKYSPEQNIKIKASLYNKWAQVNNEQIVNTSEDPNETIDIPAEKWLKVIEYLVNVQTNLIVQSSDKVFNEENLPEEEVKLSPKQGLAGLIGALTIGKITDEALDKLFIEVINLCVEKEVSPELKANFMYDLFRISINDSLAVHTREYATYYVVELEGYSPFYGDAMKLYQQKIENDKRIRLLKQYGESWNRYRDNSNKYVMTPENYNQIPVNDTLAVLLRKSPHVLFQKFSGRDIQRWAELIDYTDLNTLQAFAYALINLNIKPDSFPVGNDRLKGGAISNFYSKILQEASNLGHVAQPLNIGNFSGKDILQLIGLSNPEGLEKRWMKDDKNEDRIPEITLGLYDPNIFQVVTGNMIPKFSLNKNNKENYIDYYKIQNNTNNQPTIDNNNKIKTQLSKVEIAQIFKKVTGKQLSKEKIGNTPFTGYDKFFIQYKGLLSKSKQEVIQELEQARMEGDLGQFMSREAPQIDTNNKPQTDTNNKPQLQLSKDEVAEIFKEVTGRELSKVKGSLPFIPYELFFVRNKKLLTLSKEEVRKVLLEARDNGDLDQF